MPYSVSLFSTLVLAFLIFGCASSARAQSDTVYSLPEAAAGTRYDEDIPVAGVRVAKFEVVKGSLPPGIDLGQTTGHLFGLPTDVETKAYVFTVRVTHSGEKTTEFQLELVVKGGTPTLLLPVKGGAQPGGRTGTKTTTARAGSAQPAEPAGATEGAGGDKAAAKPVIDSPLTEGPAAVTGFMPMEGVKLVVVEVFPATADAAKLDAAKMLRRHDVKLAEGGRFTANVSVPLTRGQKVRVRAEMLDPKKKDLTSDAVTVERETLVQTRLIEGVKQIKGTADQKAGQVYAETKVGDDAWRQIGVGKVDADTGAFTITLENALTRRDEVRVYREGATPVKLSVENTVPPDLKPALLEGARTVSGYSTARSARIEVQVLPEESEEVGADRPLFQSQPLTVNQDTGEFTVQVPGLVAGQRVRARVENTDTWSATERVETLGDWGRVRGYFGIGMMLSKDADQSFSRRDLFLNFNIDSNWYHRPHYKSILKDPEQRLLVDEFLGRFNTDQAGQGTTAGQAIAAEKATLQAALKRLDEHTGLSDEERMATRRILLLQSLERLKGNPLMTSDRLELINNIVKKLERSARRRWDVHLNTFFDARLTPVPVTGQGTAAGGTGQDAFNSFVSSEKGALMQFGVYAPVFNHDTMTWNHRGSRNAVFVGPIGRVGVQTVFNKEALADSAVFKDNDLFNFFAVGARFGHYKLSGSDDRAPRLISYLDITRGRWQNLERLIDTGETNNAGEKIFVRRRPMRWALEGRLKIPALPFLIGFDSNIGEGPDDLRFLFGTNFDIAQLFSLLR